VSGIRTNSTQSVLGQVSHLGQDPNVRKCPRRRLRFFSDTQGFEPEPCHPLGMSGHEYELACNALSPAEQAKGRRRLLGISTTYRGMALWRFAGVQHLRWLGALMVIIGGYWRCHGLRNGTRAHPRKHSPDRAYIAAVPEVGTLVVVYGCLVVGSPAPSPYWRPRSDSPVTHARQTHSHAAPRAVTPTAALRW